MILVSVAGKKIKQPSDLGFEFYNLTKSGRVGSGKMMIDIIAQKSKLTLVYDVLSGPDLSVIKKAIYDPNVPFFNVAYADQDGSHNIKCYSGAIKYKRFRSDGIMYWKDVSFDLIEQ